MGLLSRLGHIPWVRILDTLQTIVVLKVLEIVHMSSYQVFPCMVYIDSSLCDTLGYE
jgi:hypothetical protein